MSVPGVDDAAGGPPRGVLPPITSSQQAAAATGGSVAESINRREGGQQSRQQPAKPKPASHGIADGTYRLGDLLSERAGDPDGSGADYDPADVVRRLDSEQPPLVESSGGSASAAAALRILSRRGM